MTLAHVLSMEKKRSGAMIITQDLEVVGPYK